MDYSIKKKEIQAKFDELTAKRDQCVAETQNIETELLRLQGEYRLITELEKPVLTVLTQ